MMNIENKSYTYKISEEEHKEYLTYVYNNKLKVILMRIWLSMSIPLLVLFTILFLDIRSGLFTKVLIVVALLWLIIFSNILWKKITKNKIELMYKKIDNLISYNNVEIILNNDTYKVQELEFYYKNILNIVTLKKTVIIFNKTGVIIIPKEQFIKFKTYFK